MNDLSNDVLVD
jgi:hypothetical protein